MASKAGSTSLVEEFCAFMVAIVLYRFNCPEDQLSSVWSSEELAEVVNNFEAWPTDDHVSKTLLKVDSTALHQGLHLFKRGIELHQGNIIVFKDIVKKMPLLVRRNGS
jgi:hypothetical protein